MSSPGSMLMTVSCVRAREHDRLERLVGDRLLLDVPHPARHRFLLVSPSCRRDEGSPDPSRPAPARGRMRPPCVRSGGGERAFEHDRKRPVDRALDRAHHRRRRALTTDPLLRAPRGAPPAPGAGAPGRAHARRRGAPLPRPPRSPRSPLARPGGAIDSDPRAARARAIPREARLHGRARGLTSARPTRSGGRDRGDVRRPRRLASAVPRARARARLRGPRLTARLLRRRHRPVSGDGRPVPDLDVALILSGSGQRRASTRRPPRPERAAEALAFLRPRIAVPIHWGTYAPLHHGVASLPPFLRNPRTTFLHAAAEQAPDVDVRVLAPGEALAF